MKKYSVKAVSQMTGISPDTLRAWERRYQAVTPDREPGGRRYYNDDSVKRLQLLKKVVDNGHAIGMVANLPGAQLKELIDTEEPQYAAARPAETLLVQLLRTVQENDLAEFERIISFTAATMSAREFALDVVRPLLERIGERWYEGKLSIMQEHAVSAALRHLLGSMLRMHPSRPDRPGILFGTVSGERHEFGILLLCLLAAGKGFRCHYLGPDLPADELARAAVELRVAVVGVSLVYVQDAAFTAGQIAMVSEALPDEIELWIGGHGAGTVAPLLPEQYSVHVADVADFERRLALLNAVS
jgi:DNA-binding transcriptional MerR regulator/methylmalonyl-CoA mutase cobalamin-binding subunit